MKYFFILFLFFPIHGFAKSFSSASTTSYSVGVSYFSMGLFNKVSTSKYGSADSLGTGYTPIQLGLFTQIFGRDFNPRFYITPVSVDSRGTGSKESFYSLYLPMSFSGFLSDWIYSAGPGLFIFNIEGSGGIATLNNGTGTANYAKPGSTSTAKYFYLGAGVARKFDNLRVDLDLWLMAPASEDKRSFNLNAALSYLF